MRIPTSIAVVALAVAGCASKADEPPVLAERTTSTSRPTTTRPTTTSRSTTTTTAAPPTTTTSAPPTTTTTEPQGFGDGTYVVGEDIAPGTYQTDGGEFCYWERLAGFSGSFEDIIANGVPTGPAVVTIAPSDAGFTSEGCGTWRPR